MQTSAAPVCRAARRRLLALRLDATSPLWQREGQGQQRQSAGPLGDLPPRRLLLLLLRR